MKFEQNGYLVTDTRTSDLKATEISLSVTVPTGSQIDVTVYQDTSGGTTADNTETITDASTATYTLSNFSSVNNATYWIRFDLSTTDDSVTPTVDGATVYLSQSFTRTAELTGDGDITTTRTTALDRSSVLSSDGDVTAFTTLSSVRTALLSGDGDITATRTTAIQRTSVLTGNGIINGSRNVLREPPMTIAQEQWNNYGIAFYERSNTYKLVEGLLGYNRNTNVTRLNRNHYVETATEGALDRIGELVQCYRKTGESDDSYAARIKAFGIGNVSDGTFRDVLDAVVSVLDVEYEDVRITYDPAVATISVPVGTVTNSELTDTEFRTSIERSILAGHRLELQKRGENPFTLKQSGDTDDPELGLTGDDTSLGGGLVETI